jgi:hypothetical protein
MPTIQKIQLKMTLVNRISPVRVANEEGLMLNDIIPARHKLWWHYPGLRTLNLLLLCAVVTDITNGKSLSSHGSNLPFSAIITNNMNRI